MKRFALLAVLLAIAAGCVGMRDVTGDPTWTGDYRPGNTYRLLTDVAFTKSGLMVADAPTVETYRSDPPSRRCGVVEPGTVVSLTSVFYRHHPENGDTLHPRAIVQTGAFKGTMVDLSLISRPIPGKPDTGTAPAPLQPDPRYLIKVPPASPVQSAP